MIRLAQGLLVALCGVPTQAAAGYCDDNCVCAGQDLSALQGSHDVDQIMRTIHGGQKRDPSIGFKISICEALSAVELSDTPCTDQEVNKHPMIVRYMKSTNSTSPTPDAKKCESVGMNIVSATKTYKKKHGVVHCWPLDWL